MKYSGKYQNGFTLIEVIAVLIILGIISLVAFSRSSNTEASLYSETEVIKTHLRYAQTQAMNKTTNSTVLVWGIKCDGTNYWLFEGTNPDDANKIRVLSDNAAGNDNKLSLATKKVGLSSFTVFFDGRGVPYSAYTTTTANTPLTAAQTITVTPQGKSSPTRTITITPLTGYIP
jgi:MSHA pilin protein MshC